MFYLYEMSSVDRIKQYNLSTYQNEYSIVSFDTDSDEKAMDMASEYIRVNLDVKTQFGISMSV
ncbi:TPA: hypothetical protein MI490_17625 [Klebsiella pneumoniae]|nr:hypothetical protein AM486_19770 [Klebsiella pneumoniae]HBX4431482.1 hypothetical protein [Klebsiella pneumoniae]HBY6305951.1 hypothetical protein [Klebsiella pneumoniae]HBY6634115.1 hypothetical protein [Klebsiella pneumoniae]HBY6709600.1 hypothetical protein [Klebsiella pneumoniae]